MDGHVSEIIEDVRKIEIESAHLVDSIFQSSYESVFKGRGIEFSEVREYEYGDDIRTIDWAVTARTGKLHIKEFVEERDLTVLILFDVSGSTHWGTGKSVKRDLMVKVCASLAFSAFRSNDKVGLVLFTDRIEKFIPPKKDRGNVYKIIKEMAFHVPESRGTDIAAALRFASKITKKRSVIFLVSDFVTDISHVMSESRLLKRKNDVICIMVVDPRDFELPDVGLMWVENPETGEQLLVDTSNKTIREKYKKNSLELRDTMNKALKTCKADMITISTIEDFVKPLLKFFNARKKRHR